jgi:hypothetical protein
MPVTYPLSLPPAALWFNIVITLVLLAVPVLVWHQTKAKSKVAAAIGVSIAAAVAMLVFYLLWLAPKYTEAVLGEGLLQVNVPPYARLEIRREQIRYAYLADWREVTALSPVLRTGGTAINGYRTGHFRLNNGADAVIMAAGSRVLVLQLADHFVLLAPDDFASFVQEFSRQVVPLSSPPAEVTVPMPLENGRELPFVVRIVLLVGGLLLLILGYLIRFKKMLWLLSGYDERKVKNKEALARFAGNYVILIGIFMLIVSAFNIPIYYLIVTLPVAVYVTIRMNRL